jgi:hypothetical protein
MSPRGVELAAGLELTDDDRALLTEALAGSSG